MRRVQTMKIPRVSVAILLVVLGVLTSSPAQALELVGADPAANSTIKSAPGAITLTLSSEIIETGSSMSVRAPSGSAVDDGSLLIDGVQALIGLAKLTESGRYTVDYQFMSTDGELLSGSYTFTFDAPAVVTTPTINPTQSPIPTESEESEESQAEATGKSSLATDIFMISLLVISLLVLIFIARSLRNTKPKRRKKK
jgi:methionine-rich copper-binding protein CopC